jgi:hypothetical protein
MSEAACLISDFGTKRTSQLRLAGLNSRPTRSSPTGSAALYCHPEIDAHEQNARLWHDIWRLGFNGPLSG